MANVSYYFTFPDAGIRKGFIEAHKELSKAGRTIYTTHPILIPFYTSFKNRNNIEAFLSKTIDSMETFTEIERLKKLEVIYYKKILYDLFEHYAKVAVFVFTCAKLCHIRPEWKYKHKIMYMPYIPTTEIPKRLGWLSLGLTMLYFSSVVPKFMLCFYYPALLADLQIGEEFELGYWTTKFVKSLN